MNYKTLIALYDKLFQLTKTGVLTWKKTGESEFGISFSRSSVEVVNSWNCNPPLAVVNIYNEDGILVAYIAEEELPDPEYGGAVVFAKKPADELLKVVHDKVYKFDVTEKNLLEELTRIEHPTQDDHTN